MGDAPIVNGWHEAALVTMALSGMLLTAQIFSRNYVKIPKHLALEGGRAANRPVAHFGD